MDSGRNERKIMVLFRDSEGVLRVGEIVGRLLTDDAEGANAKLSVSADDVLYRFLCELSEGWKAYLRVSSMSETVVARGPVHGEEWCIGAPREILASPEPNPQIVAALKERGYGPPGIDSSDKIWEPT